MIVILAFLAGTVEMDENCVVISTPPLFMVFACVLPLILCHLARHQTNVIRLVGVGDSGVFVGFELLLFGLTLVKFVEACRNGWNRMPLLTLVVRDGTWAFLVIFGPCYVVLICGIGWLTVGGHSRYQRQCWLLFWYQRSRIISRHRV